MAATYQIYAQHHLKYVTIQGHTELIELRTLAETFLQDPAFSTDLRHLIDLSTLTDARARFADVFSLRNFYLRSYGPVPRPIPVAIVAPTDLGYGISNMFAALMIGQSLMRVKIFSKLDEALSWLEIDAGFRHLNLPLA